jgi:hypothetical protein
MEHHISGAEPHQAEDSGAQDMAAGDYSVTFGVYDEGDGVRSLYLHPTAAIRLGAALLPICLGGRLAVLSDHAALPGASPLNFGGWLAPGEAVLKLQAPLEIALVDDGVTAEQVDRLLPASVLAFPDRALPEELGARFALVMSDPFHAVVLSRDPVVLRACLRSLISDLAAVSLDPEVALPDVPESALDELLEPMDDGDWCRVRATERRRYRLLEVDSLPTSPAEAASSRATWVADRGGGAWRAGWRW